MADNCNFNVLRRPEVERKTGLTRSAIYQFVSEGTFPKPIKLGLRASGWLQHEVDSWIAERMSERGEAA